MKKIFKINISHKKIFPSIGRIFLIFLISIFFNNQNIFAEENKDLIEKMNEIKSEIKKNKILNICTDIPKNKIGKKETLGDKLENKYKNDFDETFMKEKYKISEKGIENKNEFLKKVSDGGLQNTIDSFTIQFSGNYCFQRDLKTINDLLYFSIEYGSKLAENCQNTNGIENTIKEIKEIKNNFEDESLKSGNFYKYKNGGLYSLEFGENLCEGDSITKAFEKLDELKTKIENLSNGEGAFFDNFSFNISKEELERIEKNQKNEAESYVTSNINKTLSGFGMNVEINEENKISGQGDEIKNKINRTITSVSKTIGEKINYLLGRKEITNYEAIEEGKNINHFLNENQNKENNSKFANTATKNFEKNFTFNELEEDGTNEIILNLKLLENEIVKSNGKKKELEEFGIKDPENKDFKNLKNFILKLSKFLNKHNEEAGTVSQKGVFNSSSNYDDYR